MRRRLLQAGSWSLATGAALTLSWFGVHTVLAGTAYDPPRATPISRVPEGKPGTGGGEPESSSTRRPIPPHTAPPSAAAPQGSLPGLPDSSGPSGPWEVTDTGGQDREEESGAPSSGADSDTVRSYMVSGGQVAFDLGPDSATLVSAIPDSGWDMRVWTQTKWIRVTFASGGRAVSVFCTWNGTAPRVETYEE